MGLGFGRGASQDEHAAIVSGHGSELGFLEMGSGGGGGGRLFLVDVVEINGGVLVASGHPPPPPGPTERGRGRDEGRKAVCVRSFLLAFPSWEYDFAKFANKETKISRHSAPKSELFFIIIFKNQNPNRLC